MATGQGNIKITADTSQAQRALGDLDRALEGLQRTTVGAAKAFAAVTAAAAGIGYAIKSALDGAGELFDAAETLGMSVGSLQVFQKAAALVGVTADELNNSLMRMNANIGDALLKGTGPAVDAFERLGINMQEINAMKPDKQFETIAKKLSEIPNHAERSALAMDLFGKQGPKILKIADNLEEVNKKMKAMGLIISPEQQAALDLAGDKLDGLVGTISTGWKKAVASIAPYIIAVVDAIDKAIISAGGMEAILVKVGAALKFAMNVALIMGMVKAVQLLVLGIKNAQTAFILFNTLVKRSPLFLLVGAAAALATYFGVDVVGSVDKWLGLSEKVAGAHDQIAVAAEEIRKKNAEANTELAKYNDAQKKILKALDETIAKKALEVSYLQNVIALGEDEANIRKAIAEEERKLTEAKINLGDAVVKKKLQEFEANLRSEQSLKNQIKLQQEQTRFIEESQAATSAFGKELERLGNMNVAFKAGMTEQQFKESQQLLIKQLGLEKAMQETALYQQRQKISREIDNEIAKFSPMLAAEQKYYDQVKVFDEIQNAVNINRISLTLEQQKGLYEARRILDLEYQNEKIAAEQAMNDRLLQIEMNRIQQVLQANKSGLAQQLSDADQATLQKIGQQEREKAYVAERIAFEKKSETEKAAWAIDQGAQMFSALGQHNKKAFEAAKAFNIANAIMNTYLAATKALASYPPPFNFIAMAAAIGMGMAQVATIRSQQYSGRALGGPVMGNTPYIVGENGPELFTPNTTGSITRNQDLGGGGQVNVNFTIQAVDTSGFDELLMSRRGIITQVISDAMTEKGQRGL